MNCKRETLIKFTFSVCVFLTKKMLINCDLLIKLNSDLFFIAILLTFILHHCFRVNASSDDITKNIFCFQLNLYF